MTQLVHGFYGEVAVTSYVEAVEGIDAYYGLAEMEGLPDADVYVYMFALYQGGFEVSTGTFNNVAGVGDQPGSCDQLTMYVTPETARRLLDVGLVQMGTSAEYQTFEEALDLLERNAQPHDPEKWIRAYGGWHEALTYEAACNLIEGYKETAAEAGCEADVNLAGVDSGYEMVTFMAAAPGIIDDSEYMTDEVAQRLVDAGLAGYMT